MAPTIGSPAPPADAAALLDDEARYASRVLRAFIRDGRLTSIPAREKKRRIVIRFLRDQCFTEDRPHPEARWTSASPSGTVTSRRSGAS